MLEDGFREYHLTKLNDPAANTDVAGLSGEEFETYIARILTKLGYDVSGTRATGDQGADLVAQRDGLKIIIQAKRYDGPVGNNAVQEVIGALSFYGGDEGWVVTNSTFTPSARALAQKAHIKLIDKAGLADLMAMEGLKP
jgi:HJR/Mrr/RecB family endonuclease